jgi:hypothetical protein
MNCQSICNKGIELEALLQSVQPDLVIATESWLKPAIGNPELFPANYVVYRRDRPGQDGGGVFILVSNHLISSELTEFASDHEAIWVQIKEEQGPNIIVGAYYRPPRENLDKLKDFGLVVEKVCRTNSGTIIIGGDFNLPGIDWSINSIRPYAQQSAHCRCLLDIVQDTGLEQLVHEPTRNDNLLDLIFTNNATLFRHTQSMPPLSTQADHNTVYADMLIKQKLCKQRPRKVLKYKRANWTAIKEETAHLSSSLVQEAPHMSCQQMWDKMNQDCTTSCPNTSQARLSKDTKTRPGCPRSSSYSLESVTQHTEDG